MTLELVDRNEPASVVHPDPTAIEEAPRGAVRGRRLRRFVANRLAVVGLLTLLLFAFAAVFAPWIAPHDPNEQNLLITFQSFSADHWLGVDQFGRDQLSRLIYGTRVSLYAAVVAVGISVGIGVPLGILAGFRPGPIDSLLSRFNDVLMSMPALVLGLTIVAVFGGGLTTALVAIGVIFVPRFYRLARAASRDVQAETFVEGSIAIGCSHLRTMVRHVFPNIVPPLVVQVAIMCGAAVTAEASLSFLGFGVAPPTASWGGMLNTAAQDMRSGPHLVYFPGLLIALMVLAFTFVGDGIRDALSTRRAASARRGDAA